MTGVDSGVQVTAPDEAAAFQGCGDVSVLACRTSLTHKAKVDAPDEATHSHRDPLVDRPEGEDLVQVKPALREDMRPRAEQKRGESDSDREEFGRAALDKT